MREKIPTRGRAMEFSFGEQVLDVDRRELRRRGELIELEPQVFDLLVYLVRNRERVVSKDDLLQSVWGGRIVSESTLISRINAVRKAVGDDGRSQRVIRTVSRKGFRFVGDVREESPPSTDPPRLTLALPDKPSIAVLPFVNMSGDPKQEFFGDGIAEDVITALSRYHSLFVIARNSSFTYRALAVDVKQIGGELGVRYVLEGSLRKAGNRIRVTSQLVEAETRKDVWAERYDRDLGDIFAVQDEITEAVTVAVAPAIAEAELHRAMRKPPETLDTWIAYQRGLWHLGKVTASDCALAEEFFQQAIDLDPNFADAYGGLAFAQVLAGMQFRTSVLTHALNSAQSSARSAVALDGNNAAAHASLSNVLRLRGDFRGALAEAECALSLSPNLAIAHAQRGSALVFSGRPLEGIRDLQMSLRLEPRGLSAAFRLQHVGLGYYFARAYEDALAAFGQAMRSFPELPGTYTWLPAVLGQLGRAEEARQALESAIRIAPAAFNRNVRWQGTFRPKDHAHLLEGLRKAGWKG